MLWLSPTVEYIFCPYNWIMFVQRCVINNNSIVLWVYYYVGLYICVWLEDTGQIFIQLVEQLNETNHEERWNVRDERDMEWFPQIPHIQMHSFAHWMVLLVPDCMLASEMLIKTRAHMIQNEDQIYIAYTLTFTIFSAHIFLPVIRLSVNLLKFCSHIVSHKLLPNANEICSVCLLFVVRLETHSLPAETVCYRL